MNIAEAEALAVLGLVEPGDSVLDLGAGLEAPYQLGVRLRASRYVLLDAHAEYLRRNRTDGAHVEKIVGTAPGALCAFRDGEFDVALAMDVVEHLAGPEADETLRQLRRVARVVAVFTPNGPSPQDADPYALGGDRWQTHRSAWTPEDLLARGFDRVDVWREAADGAAPSPEVLFATWRRGGKGRILIVAEFDPAGVGLGHRDALRRAGWDARLASEFVHTDRQAASDWWAVRWSNAIDPPRWAPGMFDRAALLDFAASCDVLQVCPGISQPYADDPHVFLPAEGVDAPRSSRLCVQDWTCLLRPGAAKVAFFHGALSAWANRRQYAEWYRQRGYALAASTLDYACELPADYLPPAIDLSASAPLRRDDAGAPLRVVHAPTNPTICSTSDLVSACRVLAGSDVCVDATILHGVAHADVLAAKRQAHVGFDHLRGSFSVNHLENCALGLAGLVNLRPVYAQRLADEGFAPLPGGCVVRTADELLERLRALASDPEATTRLQLACAEWAKQFRPEALRARLDAFYVKMRLEKLL